MGMSGMAFGVGTVIGPLAGTNALESFGPTATWLGCAVLGVVIFAGQWALAPALHARAAANVVA
jgi:hypothetical protein